MALSEPPAPDPKARNKAFRLGFHPPCEPPLIFPSNTFSLAADVTLRQKPRADQLPYAAIDWNSALVAVSSS
jgi:hypothetical protein